MEKDRSILFEKVSKKAGKAIVDHAMIEEGDRIVVAVSGGKDSRALLEVMIDRQAIAPVGFEIMAVHVDTGVPGPDLEELEAFFRSAGAPYHIETSDLFRDKDLSDLNCFWCSWNRRKVLFQFAQKNGFHKIALGHHLDDIAESILMNICFKGEVSAMCPKQEFFGGDLTIIRPFCHVHEEEIAALARMKGLSAEISCRCPVAGGTQRAAFKKIIGGLRETCPGVKENIFNSLRNIKEEYLP
ncbi:MAG: tRNA 2-thiocytidine(32) synthetase TtcA [Elusimicrobia bacterium]|nr:tRNA 2-thiocytidine(32) synthetase TtcA [Elusimicrobiota bacterium]